MKMKRYEHFILHFYNEITGEELETFEEVPSQARTILAHYDYEELIRAFVVRDLEAGQSRAQIAQKYKISDWTARKIGQQFGVLPRRKSRRE